MNISIINNFFILIEISSLFSFAICYFRSIKKISDDGNYFVISDNGLYIYNFENSECFTIKEIDINNESDFFIISNIYKSNSGLIKIAALINQHLYVYTYDNLNKNLEYFVIESLSKIRISQYSFDVFIDNYQLSIFLIEKDGDENGRIYNIKTYNFENYASITNSEPVIKKHNSNLINFPDVCHFDNYNSLIKCIYMDSNDGYLKFLIIDNMYTKVSDTKIESHNTKGLPYAFKTFSYSANMVLICFWENSVNICYYISNSDADFIQHSYSFENSCLNLETYFLDDPGVFLLSCKTCSNYYQIYKFYENSINDVSSLTLEFENNDATYFIIYSAEVYHLVSEEDYSTTCVDNFLEKESTNIINIDTTNQIQMQMTNRIKEIIDTTEINLYSTIKTKIEQSSNIYNYNNSSNLFTNYSEFIYESIENFKKNIFNDSFNITSLNEGNDYIISKDGLLIIFTTTYTQKIKENNYETSIDLGKCQDKLIDFYKIDNKSSLYILKIEIEQKWMNIPKIEYEVYYPLNNSKMKKLNLSICEDIKIEIFIPINITDDVEKYNPKSDYYNDICSKTTTENDTDIILKDRRNQFIDKNMSLCEDNCEFINYNKENKKVKCECEIKTLLSFVDEIKIGKNNLIKNFKNIHNIANIQIMKCYKKVFNKRDLLKNYGFFIIASILVLLIICLILFFVKYYNVLIKELNEIVTAKKEKEKLQNKTNIKEKTKKKLKTLN